MQTRCWECNVLDELSAHMLSKNVATFVECLVGIKCCVALFVAFSVSTVQMQCLDQKGEIHLVQLRDSSIVYSNG